MEPGTWFNQVKGSFGKFYSVPLAIILWEVVARVINESLFLPTFSTVIIVFFKMIFNLELIPHIYISMARALSGFLLAVIIGIPLGLIMGWSRRWDSFWSPLISLVYPIPKIGLIPLFILWLGIGDTSKVAVIFTAAT